MDLICIICHFETELDDSVVRGSPASNRCICLRCYCRETETTMPMPKLLRAAVNEALAAAAGG